jgi:hypothetical protein
MCYKSLVGNPERKRLHFEDVAAEEESILKWISMKWVSECGRTGGWLFNFRIS